MIDNYFTGLYDGIFPDKRLEKRMEKVSSDLLRSGSAIVNIAAQNHASKIGAYRLLMNKQTSHEKILFASFKKCAGDIDVEHVLCIQDTTEFNFNHISNKLGREDLDIGPTTNKKIAGLFCHPMLVTDVHGETIYGLSSASIYNRKWEQKNKHQRNYPQLPIEEKESYRWLENAQKTRERISPEVAITVIGDRESDIYDEFTTLDQPNTHLLVRSRADRNIVGENKKLYTELETQPLAGAFTLSLSSNKSRDKRQAKIEVRFCEAEIKAPKNSRKDQSSITIYAIEAKEITPNLPTGQAPVLWRLLTTHVVKDLPTALLQCIEWYKQRWLIEELFRVLKTKGFQLESSQLGNGAAIKKLVAFTLEAALQVMRLKLALDRKQQTSAKLIFSKQ